MKRIYFTNSLPHSTLSTYCIRIISCTNFFILQREPKSLCARPRGRFEVWRWNRVSVRGAETEAQQRASRRGDDFLADKQFPTQRSARLLSGQRCAIRMGCARSSLPQIAATITRHFLEKKDSSSEIPKLQTAASQIVVT